MENEKKEVPNDFPELDELNEENLDEDIPINF